MTMKVFVSYRREDSKYQARRIYDAFAAALPAGTVFMDVDSISPGADFIDSLEGWVEQCDVLLALIGPGWVNSLDPRTNQRRLDNPEDFVRIEIRGALSRRIPVVPVLLDAAQMPLEDELPDDMKTLRRRHAEFVDFRTFDVDVQRLFEKLRISEANRERQKAQAEIAPIQAPASQTAKETPLRKSRAVLSPANGAFAALAIAVLVALLAVRSYVGLSSAAKLAARDAETMIADLRATLDKADKARQEAEKRAEAALADSLAAASAQEAAEAKANEAENGRREAESRARDSESGRRELEVKLKALLDRVPMPTKPHIPPIIEQMRAAKTWALYNSVNCGNPQMRNTLEVGSTYLSWHNAGGTSEEVITASSEIWLQTTTTSSQRQNTGQKWLYALKGNQILVQSGDDNPYLLVPCS
jgi:hypothetical protein